MLLQRHVQNSVFITLILVDWKLFAHRWWKHIAVEACVVGLSIMGSRRKNIRALRWEDPNFLQKTRTISYSLVRRQKQHQFF